MQLLRVDFFFTFILKSCLWLRAPRTTCSFRLLGITFIIILEWKADLLGITFLHNVLSCTLQNRNYEAKETEPNSICKYSRTEKKKITKWKVNFVLPHLQRIQQSILLFLVLILSLAFL